MYFKLQDDSIDVEITTSSKYTILLGDSGTGKTYTLDFLNDLKDTSIAANVSASHKWDVINNRDASIRLQDSPKDFINHIVFIDEFQARPCRQLMDTMDAYFILVSRSVKVLRDCGYKDIYSMSRIDGTLRVRREYPDFNLPSMPFTFDVCLTEDSGHEAKFFSSWYNTQVVYGDGKVTFSKQLPKLPHSYKVLLVFDGGGIGSCIRQVLKRIEVAAAYTDVYCCVPDCFEQLLAHSVFTKDQLPGEIVANNKTTEQLYEQFLENATTGKPWKYSHKGSILSQCWIQECSDCVKNCDARIGNKLQAILSAGPCKDLLQGKCSQKVHEVVVPSNYAIPEYYALLSIRKHLNSVTLFTTEHSCYNYFHEKTVFRCSYNHGYAVFYTFVVKTTKGLIVYNISIKIGSKQYADEQSFDYLHNIEEVQI